MRITIQTIHSMLDLVFPASLLSFEHFVQFFLQPIPQCCCYVPTSTQCIAYPKCKEHRMHLTFLYTNVNATVIHKSIP